MKRLLPTPMLTLALIALWLTLNDAFSAAHWLMALLLGVLVPLLTRSLRPTPVRMRRPGVAFTLFWRVGLDMIVSNWRVLRGTLARDANLPQGGFVTVPLDLRDPTGLAVLAAIMCAVPGTIWSELALDHSAVRVHLFDIGNAQAEIDLIKSRYERPLMEIFE